MADSFEDLLDLSSLWIMPYLTISGVDQVFSNVPIPAEWDDGGATCTIDGETYSWNQSLITGESFGAVSQRAQPKSGLGYVGSMDFEFLINQWWLGYLNDNIDRTDEVKTKLMASLAPGATTAFVEDEQVFAGDSGYVHIGTECVYYDDRDGNSLLDLTRGRFGSWPLYHVAGDDTQDLAINGGGPLVTSWALAHKKRLVRLWLAPGREVGGRFVPYSTGPRGALDAEVWAGLTWDMEWDRDTLRVRLDCSDLLQFFNRQIARFPKGVATLSPRTTGVPLIQVSGDNNLMPVDFIKYQNLDSTATETRLYNNGVIEGNSDADLTPGLYTLDELARYLSATLDDATRTKNKPDIGTPSANAWRVRLTRNGTKVTAVIAWSGPLNGQRDWVCRINAASRQSIWGELGFEGIVEAVAEPNSNSTFNTWTFDASRALPTLRVPMTASPDDLNLVRTLYARELAGPPLNASFAAATNDGGTVSRAFRLGDHFVFEAGSTGTGFVDIAEKNRYGTRQTEEVYDEWKPDKPARTELVRGLGFAGVGELRMLLHLLLGGSGTVNHNHATYDKLWRVPDFVPADLVDVASFETIDDELFTTLGRDNWFIDEPTAVRDVAQDVLTANQCFIVPTWSAADGRFKIRCLRWEPPTQDEIIDAFELSHSNVISTLDMGVTLQTTQNELVNGVQALAGFDNAKKKWLREVISTDLTSANTFGRGEPLSLRIRGVANPVDAVSEAIDAAANLYLSFAMPYHVVVVAVASLQAWALQLGDPVALTHSVLPSRSQAGRGVERLAGRIVGKVDLFRGRQQRAARSLLTLVLPGGGSARYGKWAPCCRGTYNGSSAVVGSILDHAYSASSETMLDVEYFQIDGIYRVYTPGDESTAITGPVVGRIVGSGNASNLTFRYPLTGIAAGPVIVEQCAYGNPDKLDSDRAWLHMSDGDGKLDRPGDDDPPYYWS
jgi:hypothetical protein